MTHPISPLTADDLVLCDFDGTVTLEDHGLAAMERYSPVKGMELERRWRRGEIGSMECLREQWGLLDLSPEEFHAFVDTIAVDPGVHELVALCASRGAELWIVSDGLDLYVQRHLEREGLGDVPTLANHAWFEGRRISIDFPYQDPQCKICGNCKTAHLRRLREGKLRVIYLGDGYSDQCPAREADVVFAKDDLAEIMQREHRPYHPFSRLADVVTALRARTGTDPILRTTGE